MKKVVSGHILAFFLGAGIFMMCVALNKLEHISLLRAVILFAISILCLGVALKVREQFIRLPYLKQYRYYLMLMPVSWFIGCVVAVVSAHFIA